MKLARYIGQGEIAIVDEPIPPCPPGGLLVRTEASGLCSGELMDWYMDRKIPHVLGHEVAGEVVESQDERFPVGYRVFVHHHAPCLHCEMCRKGLHVHCEQWKRTKLIPGGMAEYFAAPADNLNDTIRVDDLRPQDAALIEPLGCVVKSLGCGNISRRFNEGPEVDDCLRDAPDPAAKPEARATRHPSPALPSTEGSLSVAVVGLGSMGLMHMLLLPNAIGYDLSESRLAHARSLELEARQPEDDERADLVFVCPGNKPALDLAIDIINPCGTIVLFAPMPPGEETPVDLNRLYFQEVRLVSSYSCGPGNTAMAAQLLRQGTIKAEQVVSDFIGIDELPEAYQKMKRGEILKAMVMFE